MTSRRYASIVVDAQSGQILHEDRADERKYPASLTKMMTLYMTFDALERGKLRLDQMLPVSAHAEAQAPTKLGVRAGDSLMVEHAILGLVTKSANDAAVVLAEAMGGTERNFAGMMTERARQIGMSRSTFRNASGLPNDEQFSTARDMAVLARGLIYSHAKYYHYFSRTSFVYRGAVHPNHNRLMGRYEGMDGLKTGYIRASGFNLTASAVRNGRRLIAVVFGGPSTYWRDEHLASLLDQEFARIGAGPAIARRQAPVQVAQAAQNDAGDEDSAEVAGKVMRAMTVEQPGARKGDAGKITVHRPGPVHTVPAGAAPKVAARGGAWGVQVGAYSDRKISERAAAAAQRKLPDQLGRTRSEFLPIATKAGTVYRARLIGVDEKTARAVCAQLQKQGEKCITVKP